MEMWASPIERKCGCSGDRAELRIRADRRGRSTRFQCAAEPVARAILGARAQVRACGDHRRIRALPDREALAGEHGGGLVVAARQLDAGAQAQRGGLPVGPARSFQARSRGQRRFEVAALHGGAGVFHRRRDVGALQRVLLERLRGAVRSVVGGGGARTLEILEREERQPDQHQWLRTHAPGQQTRHRDGGADGDPRRQSHRRPFPDAFQEGERHLATVERQDGEQIEDCPVHAHHLEQRQDQSRDRPLLGGQDLLQGKRQASKKQAGDRTRQRENELLRRPRPGSELRKGHPAERFQPDLRAPTVGTSDDGVPELVNEHAEEHDEDPGQHPPVEPQIEGHPEQDRAEEEPGVHRNQEGPDLEAEHTGSLPAPAWFRSRLDPTLSRGYSRMVEASLGKSAARQVRKKAAEQPFQYPLEREYLEPDWTRLPGYRGVSRAQWEDATWQRKNTINTMDEENLQEDPLRRYMLPAFSDRRTDWPSHPKASRDSLHEAEMWKVEGLTHRYPTKVLAEMLSTCPQYCGHCTRMDLVGNSVPQVKKLKFAVPQKDRHQQMLDYLRATPSVRDVVVSGGDIANMPIQQLEPFVASLLDLPNIKDVRLAKKAFSRGVNLSLHTHVNHANQVTPLLGKAAGALLSMGFRDVRNQGVLLRGVNDSQKALLDLCFMLQDHARVLPYYFYMCDMIPSSEHWRTTVAEAQKLQHDLMGYLPGFATPRIVCDVPYVGKRWIHQVAEYDREKGISYWTKNYRTGIEDDGPEALTRRYEYYDPIYPLPEGGQRWWREQVAKGAA